MINSNINGDISLSKINEDISNESIWSSNDNKKINESITLNSECYENKKTEQLKYSEDTREVSGSHEKCMDNSQDNSKIFRKASFFDFVSRSEEDIFKLESPLYELRRKTVITKTTDPRRISIFSKQTTRHSYVKGKKVHDPSKKYKDGCPTRLGKRALMKVHIADIMEIKSHKGLFLNIIQIINTIIRFTIIQFPLCFRVLGLAFGPLIVCMIAIMSVFSVYMLLKVKEYTRER